jgi:hypothetical protein
VAEELRNDAKTIGFVAMDRVVVFGKHGFEEISP